MIQSTGVLKSGAILYRQNERFEEARKNVEVPVILFDLCHGLCCSSCTDTFI